jgi:hypothetical protein
MARFVIVENDVLHDLADWPQAEPAGTPVTASFAGRRPEPQAAIDFVRVGHQLEQRRRVQAERQRYVDIVRDYLTRSFEARIRATESRVMGLRARELAGEAEVAFPASGPSKTWPT